MVAQKIREELKHYEKIASDPEITEEMLESFCDDLADSLKKGGEMEESVKTLMRGRKLKGSPIDFTPEERFGHVCTTESFRRAFMERKKWPVSRRDFDDFFYGLAELSPEEGAKRTRQAWGVPDNEQRNVPISPSPFMWLFRNEDNPQNPFQNLPLEKLPCILGEKKNKERNEFYALSIVPCPDKRYCKPTAFDAGTNIERWRPGGKTHPRAECIDSTGLPEVVTKTHCLESLGETFIEFSEDLTK